MCLCLMNTYIFLALKLEIALAMLASNEQEIEGSISSTRVNPLGSLAYFEYNS